MSRPCVLGLANLDFEEELGSAGGYQTSQAMAETMHRWRRVLRLLPGARWAHCLDTPTCPLPDDQLDLGTRLLLWGVTPSTLTLAARLGVEGSLPRLEAVREVNDKRFSHRLERELGISLPGSRTVETMAELEAAVKDCPHDWVLKHPLGFAGRERALGKRGQLSESALGWARRRLRAGWSLLFEPWLETKSELSLHFEIRQDFGLSYLGHTLLRSDASGVYRGNAVVTSSRPAAEITQVGWRVAERVAQQGYWGPLGIDAMTGTLGGTEVVRPLTELNARLNFGRLTLALQPLIPPGWSYRWWHPRAADRKSYPTTPLPTLDSTQASHAQATVCALPEWADPEQRSGTRILLAPSAEQLEALEQKLTEL